MSFLKKAAQAAATAKEQAIVAKGRVDELRAERDAASVAPVATARLDDGDRARLAHALAAGATDPTELLGREEASEIAGTALGLASLGGSDMSLNADYVAEDRRRRRWSVTVCSWYLPEGGTPADVWDALEPAAEAGEPVDGLGRAAFAQDDHVFAWVGDEVFSVEVRLPDETDTRDRALEAARLIAARVG